MRDKLFFKKKILHIPKLSSVRTIHNLCRIFLLQISWVENFRNEHLYILLPNKFLNEHLMHTTSSSDFIVKYESAKKSGIKKRENKDPNRKHKRP